MFGDNAAAVQVNNNLGALGSRVRHLELSHFMTRDLVLSAMPEGHSDGAKDFGINMQGE